MNPKRQNLYTHELNKTGETARLIENFHASECRDLLSQAGLLDVDRIAMLLDQTLVEEKKNKSLEALMKMTYAKIASREGNFRFATELYSSILQKIRVLNSSVQQESARTLFYYDYSAFLAQIGLQNSSILYLERAREIVRTNKLKQMIAYQLLVKQRESLRTSVLRNWYQSIAYFERYEMRVMLAQAHYDLAGRFLQENELQEASAHLDQAHETATPFGYNYLRGKIDLMKGHLLYMQEREPELVLFYESLLKKTKSNYFKTRIYVELATLYLKRGEKELAIEAAKMGVDLSQRFAIESELPRASTLLGRLYHRHEKDMTRASFYFQQGHGMVMDLAESNIPIIEDRLQVVRQYVEFLEEHLPGDASSSPNEDLFAFSRDLAWVKIKDLFHYNLFLYHYMNTGVGNKTLDALELPASSFYSTTERLRRRGIPFPNFRKIDTEIPAENYEEGLQQYCRMHRDLKWPEINEQFEKDMLAYHYKLNNYNKKRLANNLGLAYSGVVNRTRYLTGDH